MSECVCVGVCGFGRYRIAFRPSEQAPPHTRRIARTHTGRDIGFIFARVRQSWVARTRNNDRETKSEKQTRWEEENVGVYDCYCCCCCCWYVDVLLLTETLRATDIQCVYIYICWFIYIYIIDSALHLLNFVAWETETVKTTRRQDKQMVITKTLTREIHSRKFI